MRKGGAFEWLPGPSQMGPDIFGQGHPACDGQKDVPAKSHALSTFPFYHEEGNVC